MIFRTQEPALSPDPVSNFITVHVLFAFYYFYRSLFSIIHLLFTFYLQIISYSGDHQTCFYASNHAAGHHAETEMKRGASNPYSKNRMNAEREFPSLRQHSSIPEPCFRRERLSALPPSPRPGYPSRLYTFYQHVIPISNNLSGFYRYQQRFLKAALKEKGNTGIP